MSNSAPTPGRLQDRIAIITGSSGRLGRAISLLFASEGATLFLVDKYAALRNPINARTGKADDWETRYDPSSPQPPPGTTTTSPQPPSTQWTPTHDLISQLHSPEKVHFHATDLTSEPAVHTMLQTCLSLHGRVDILINAHGISVESTHPSPLPIHLTPLSDFTRTMDINTTSLFLTTKSFLAQVMRQPVKFEGGAAWIVNVASVQAKMPYYGTSSYCASKGAVLMLTRQVALDYAGVGVRCNAVCPGFLDSDMTRNLRGDGEVLGRVERRHPLNAELGGRVGGKGIGEMVDGLGRPGFGEAKGGLGRVDDVARMVLVLAGDDARWVTGQGINVDGGYTIS